MRLKKTPIHFTCTKKSDPKLLKSFLPEMLNIVVGESINSLNDEFEFFNLVLDDTLGRAQQSGRLALVSPGLLQGFNNQGSFIAAYKVGKHALLLAMGRIHLHLHGRRQMYALNSVAVNQQRGPLNTVLKLPDIAGPVIGKQQVDNGW